MEEKREGSHGGTKGTPIQTQSTAAGPGAAGTRADAAAYHLSGGRSRVADGPAPARGRPGTAPAYGVPGWGHPLLSGEGLQPFGGG